MTEKYWQGTDPGKCDVCTMIPLATGFVDGKTIYGSWANMCPACHAEIGVGLGTGRGQRYERQPDGRWKKVEG